MSYEELYEKYEKLQTTVYNQNLELNSLRKMVFGTKRETTPKTEQIENATQCSIFSDGIINDDEIYNEIKEKAQEKIEEITVHKKKNSKQKKAGIRKSSLKDAEIKIINIELNKEVVCPNCTSDLEKVGKDIIRQEIKYIPAKFEITQYVQNTYKCTKCGTKESDNEKATFVKPNLPNPLLTHSFASASLATEVIYQKYYMGVPLYRQEKTWFDKGLVLPRNMMANWNIKLSEYYFTQLYNLMSKKIKIDNKVLHADETGIQCNKEKNRNAQSNSYMWVMCSGELEQHRGVIFKYETSRSSQTAQKVLENYKGILVTDGYAAYNNIENIVHAECWAHCRRYFYDSIPLEEHKKMDTTSYGYKGLLYCNKLFEIEEQIATLKTEEKLKQRQEKSKPVLDSFFEWVNLVTTEKTIINSKLKKALTYAINQQKELSQFLNDGKIPLSNNIAERAIRPFAVHRKNWLFADSVDGAKANAIIYSLIESAKTNNLNIWKYIEYLLLQIPQLETLNDEQLLEQYLPWSKELPDEILNLEITVEDELQK